MNKRWLARSAAVAIACLPALISFEALQAQPAIAQTASNRLKSLEVTAEGQLLLRTDQPVQFDWRPDIGGNYQLILLNTQLPLNFRTLPPPLTLLRLDVNRQGTDVVINLRTRSGSRLETPVITPEGLLSLTLPKLASVPTLSTAPPSFLSITPSFGAAPQPAQTGLPPLSRPAVIVIDPGHGGRDPGAIGIGGIRETDIVLDISTQVTRLLQAQGAQVVMTRQDDREVDLAPRVAIAQRARATVFVSIHANALSMSRPDVNGLETYFFTAASRPLAQAIQDRMMQSFPDMRNRGVKQARFYVIRQTSMPSSLVEVGFVTGAQDAARLADPTFRSQMAQAIAAGILDFLNR
ncbi:N-acetylmuramoyl-L-alanine amidase [Synechococcus elongatus IITB4]|uniref:N-acetylmuramoyl-L-alanine amidase family protein n=1 Tax=Synechococcus elongatus TaxID=32046 RepID=UPI0030CB53FC